uniref:NADH dehydrogenase subunit 6 n=1 Tax=Versteria mustelae TaxID=1434714 RepID=N0DLI7_9CEST|nr:NADH dehydrogenase subunit 6 [Versteria mustelae]BAN15700.1 NADH dehydrogenase subunit 6 [Versteria mustelae]
MSFFFWLCISLYFFVLLLFSITSHCVYYCVFLVGNALLSSMICYMLYGFSWYSLLFCLVYIGGVYILFIFVSIFNPNNSFVLYSGLNVFGVLFCFVVSVGFCLFFSSYVELEFSNFLCSCSEGSLYVCLCLTLIFGFIILSLVGSVKIMYYR